MKTRYFKSIKHTGLTLYPIYKLNFFGIFYAFNRTTKEWVYTGGDGSYEIPGFLNEISKTEAFLEVM